MSTLNNLFAPRALADRLLGAAQLMIALVAALAAASLLLLALNADISAAYTALFQGAFGSANATAETLVKATPILFVAIGVSIAFRASVVNIGGEGQMIMGALGGVTAALAWGLTLGGWVVPLSLACVFVAGGLYGGLAGFLKARFNVLGRFWAWPWPSCASSSRRNRGSPASASTCSAWG